MTSEPTRSMDASGNAEASACQVCTHALATHDAIGLRFCRATQAQALTRNCICRAA